MTRTSATAATAGHPERRAAPRRKAVLSGLLLYSPSLLVTPCTIIDISKSGARIRLGGADPVGEPMFLIDLSHGLGFAVVAIWRRDDRVGLRFTDYHDLSKPDYVGPAALRRLWMQYRLQ